MRPLPLLALIAACSSAPAPRPQPPEPVPPPPETPAATPPAPAAPAVTSETLAADTPKTTVAGNTFIAPAGWTISVHGSATILAPPEPEAHIALVDVQAASAEEAVKLGWAAYRPDAKWPVLNVSTVPDKDGWTDQHRFIYQTSPNEKRNVFVGAHKANGAWLVAIYDLPEAVGEKRGAQVALIFGRLQPKGYERETFAGKQAHELDKDRIAALAAFVKAAEDATGVPGVAFGLVQHGKVVYAGGVGVRELGKKPAVDGDTLFMIASNTKALTTLLLAKLVDEGKLKWDTQVTSLLPTFKLGDADTTKQVLVKHLICACTGLPRQDLEWLLEFKTRTPESTMATLGTVQPTSKFGEMFQYSNLLAAAAGFVAGHVAYPKLELGKAYDQAMQAEVFGPLGMSATTFDYAKALRGNHAMPASPDPDGKQAAAVMEINYSAIPVRPAGAAWSNVKDMLKYVQMEIAQGMLPGGKKYISKEPLLERRVAQVPIGKDATYGMGLIVDTTYGIPVVHHGGDLIGFHSDMIWLPEHDVGAVILTNGDPGYQIRDFFRRKLLEVLFDGKPEADADQAAAAKTFFAQIAAERKLLTIPADPAEAGKLASKYHNDALGDVVVANKGGKLGFDFGEFKSEMGSRKNPDGSISFLTLTPGLAGLELVVGSKDGKRTLIMRDAQHEYVFDER
jgi:CubicO group peptidase (beta-lactamase class C family)